MTDGLFVFLTKKFLDQTRQVQTKLFNSTSGRFGPTTGRFGPYFKKEEKEKQDIRDLPNLHIFLLLLLFDLHLLIVIF